MEGSPFIKSVTGNYPVYPGDPLVLATAIMEFYSDFPTANAPTEHGWCAALSDSRIPGAGDHIGAAVRCLSIGAEGGSVDEMVAAACSYWERGQAGGHHGYVSAGIEQAKAVEPKFRELAERWFPN